MSDGSITFSTALDNEELERELAKLKKDIAKQEDSIAGQEQKKSPLLLQAQELEQKMKEARVEAARYREEWASGVVGADKNQLSASDKVQQLEAQYAKVVAQIDKIDAKLQPAYEKVDAMMSRAGGIEQGLAAAAQNTNKMGTALIYAEKKMAKFKSRLLEVVRSALIFTVITRALAKFRDWMVGIIKANAEASAALAQLNGAMLTLAQPMVTIIIPAFTMLVNVLTKIVSTLAQLFAMLSGTTIDASKKAAQALDEQTQALNNTGKAAKNAGKQLAGFDELNKLSSNEGEANTTDKPDFGFEANLDEEQLNNILALVETVGSAFLAWSIGSALGLGLGKILFLAASIYSAIQFVKNLLDAWNNGANLDNVLGMMASTAGLAVGLYLAFGKIASGIGLVITGLAMLVTGFHDADVNGWNFENLLLSIAGIMATGIGIAVLVDSWIPVLIAAIAGIVLAITVAYGQGEELIAGVKEMLGGFVDFFMGVFSGDMNRAMEGVGAVFSGLKTIVRAVLDSISTMFSSFFDWLDQKTNGKITVLIEMVKGLATGFFGWIKSVLGKSIDSLQTMLEGIVNFLSGVFTGDWDKAWSGLVQIVKGSVNLLVGYVEGFVNFFIMAINAIINALNTISVEIPDWVPEFGGQSFGINIPNIPEFQIPRLAQGAVIPANREFMAVLGDQKFGRNLEAPEGLIRQIIREEMPSSAAGESCVVLNVDGRVLGEFVIRYINGITEQTNISPILV